MRHRAEHRYTNNKYRGKHIPQREIQRRIAQSYGYVHSHAETDSPKELINTRTGKSWQTGEDSNTVFVA